MLNADLSASHRGRLFLRPILTPKPGAVASFCFWQQTSLTVTPDARRQWLQFCSWGLARVPLSGAIPTVMPVPFESFCHNMQADS